MSFAREDKAVALQYHEQWSTDTNVCGGSTVVHALSVDEHKHSPARIRSSSKVLYTVFRTTDRRRTDFLWFVGCQNSTNLKAVINTVGGLLASRLFFCWLP